MERKLGGTVGESVAITFDGDSVAVAADGSLRLPENSDVSADHNPR